MNKYLLLVVLTLPLSTLAQSGFFKSDKKIHIGVYKPINKVLKEIPVRNEDGIVALGYYSRTDTISHIRVLTTYYTEGVDDMCTSQQVSFVTRNKDIAVGILQNSGFRLSPMGHYVKKTELGDVKAVFTKPLTDMALDVRITITNTL